MWTNRIARSDGSLLAFEIRSAWLTFGPLRRILGTASDVSTIRRQPFNDNRLAFLYKGEPFVVNEPWGDSSRYWIGPAEPTTSRVNCEALWNAFHNYRPWLFRLFRGIFRGDSV